MLLKQDMRLEVTADIDKLVSYWGARNIIRKVDRSQYYLVEPERKQGFEQVTLNDPKVLWDTMVAFLTTNWPRFRIPMTVDADAGEKARMNKAERFYLGLLRELEGRQQRRGQGSWLRSLAWWVCSGWYAIHPHVELDDAGTATFWADLYDPNIIFPRFGVDGIDALAKVYDTTAGYAASMAESNGWNWANVRKAPEDQTTVKNYWLRDGKTVWNAVLIDDAFVKEPEELDGTAIIPWVVGPVSGAPEQPDNPLWQERIGESVIASNRSLFQAQNRWMSYVMQIVALAAKPEKIEKTKTGQPKIHQQDLGVGALLHMETDESLEVVKTVGSPNESMAVTQSLSQSLQRGGLPYVVYGGLGFELSGFAISQLMAAIRYKGGPYISAMQDALARTMTELLRQYKAYHGKPVTLTTTDPAKLGKGVYYVEEFSRKDVPAHLVLEVTINVATPQDKVQQLLAARQALAPPQLMSRETLWEDFLDVQDTTQEYERIKRDQTNELPVVKMIDYLHDLRARVVDMLSQGMTEHARILAREIAQVEASLGGGKGEGGGPAGQPSRMPGGVAPQVMPPEMGPGTNPDMARQIQGMGPPGLNRRPQTPQEREQTQHAKPTIYGPGGEPLR